MDNAQKEEEGVHIGQILHLDRDDEKQQHLHVREKGGKGKEHGQVNVLGAEHKVKAGDKIYRHAVDNGKDNAGEEVNIELSRAPVLLKCAAYPVIKIKGDEGKQTCAGGIEDKGEETPYLSAHDVGGGEAEVAQQHRVHSAYYPEGHICYANVFHQVWNTEIRVLIAKSVNYIPWIFHLSLHFCAGHTIIEINIPFILSKVYENFVKLKNYALSFHKYMLLW